MPENIPKLEKERLIHVQEDFRTPNRPEKNFSKANDS
jgi:hypothetical protein